MTNINKIIEEFNEYWRLYASINNIKGQCNFNNFRDNIKSHLFYSIKEALKTQEEKHQKKLEELESGINKLDEDIKYYSNKEYRANFRSEAVLLIKETFRTINKT